MRQGWVRGLVVAVALGPAVAGGGCVEREPVVAVRGGGARVSTAQPSARAEGGHSARHVSAPSSVATATPSLATSVPSVAPRLVTRSGPPALATTAHAQRPLFRRYPALEAALPVVPLARLPTPVERADALGRALGLDALYLKRDDRTAALYGGNKVRKLEFDLAAARAAGKGAVLTFGGVGSNHALATTLYARAVGLQPILMLLPEPPTAHVRHNLLAEVAAGAEMSLTTVATIDALVAAAAHGQGAPDGPYVIAPGGSSTLGNVGFVNAGLELAEQVAAGGLPEPDVVFVAMGTGGSAVGLVVGLRAAGLHTRVLGVRASSDKYVNRPRCRAMARDVVALLRRRDPSFPEVTLTDEDLVILQRYVGQGYALPTAAGARALALARAHAGLELEPTYTAKTMAAVAAMAGELRGQVVVYWHTYDERAVDHGSATPADLPVALRGYASDTR